ncbi:hypothetical protein EDI_092520 [Entamoeba dispar SAW760]|uniref:Uncharacterized protein n=1 Tax=Entamoeba dispar (strain ATCC PRA-260 / SAW760) TaxID=370354 RepID=B0ED44_ENTDS|nr:uncharacterized protein EDI_092520 [Entamoeba dispar SAW760]EDR27461.1 hypothetical protein EDI_092520 [Entamoeba dispar SAW760]|eukprot:EDR27461.1 hypothetical protein EDI_092520 [Entamoeba dispar SAW760]
MTSIKGHNAPITCVNWSLTNNFLFCSGDEKGIFRIWDFRTMKTIKAFQAPNKSSITSSQFNDDICFVSSGNEMNQLDLRGDGLFIKNSLFKDEAKDEINKIKVDTTNNRYGYCDDSGNISVFEFNSNKKIVDLVGTHESVCNLSSEFINEIKENNTHVHLCSDFVFDKKEMTLYSTGLDMTVVKSKLWNPSPKTKYIMNKCSFPKTGTNTLVNPPMAYSIDMNMKGDRLMVACGNGMIYWLTTGALKITQSFEISMGMIQQASYFNHDRLYLIATPNQLQCRSSCAYETVFARNFVGINDFSANQTTKHILVADHSCDIHLLESVEEQEDDE